MRIVVGQEFGPNMTKEEWEQIPIGSEIKYRKIKYGFDSNYQIDKAKTFFKSDQGAFEKTSGAKLNWQSSNITMTIHSLPHEHIIQEVAQPQKDLIMARHGVLTVTHQLPVTLNGPNTVTVVVKPQITTVPEGMTESQFRQHVLQNLKEFTSGVEPAVEQAYCVVSFAEFTFKHL